MKQRIAVLGGLAVVVAAAGFLVFTQQQDPTGRAAGSSAQADELWQAMSQYQGSYLRGWKRAFKTGEYAPADVLEAFNELGYAVTGPGGFWRKDLPNGWLGCRRLPDSPACEALAGTTSELEKWDAFQGEIRETDEADARKFIEANQGKMIEYIKRYVPTEPSSSAMQSTPFYQEHLAGAMEEDPLLQAQGGGANF